MIYSSAVFADQVTEKYSNAEMVINRDASVLVDVSDFDRPATVLIAQAVVAAPRQTQAEKIEALVIQFASADYQESAKAGEELKRLGKDALPFIIGYRKHKEYADNKELWHNIRFLVEGFNKKDAANAVLKAIESEDVNLRIGGSYLMSELFVDVKLEDNFVHFFNLLSDKNSEVRKNISDYLSWALMGVFDNAKNKALVSKVKNGSLAGSSVPTYVGNRFIEEKDPDTIKNIASMMRPIAWMYSDTELSKTSRTYRTKPWAMYALIRSTNFKNFGFITWVDREQTASSGHYANGFPSVIVGRPAIKSNMWVMDQLDAVHRAAIADQLARVDELYASLEVGISTAAYVSEVECEYSVAVRLGSIISLGAETYISRIENLFYEIGGGDSWGSYEAREAVSLLKRLKVPKPVEDHYIEILKNGMDSERQVAAIALSGSTSAKAIEVLKAALKDTDDTVKSYALLALKARGVR